jgi:hypothetical protein
VTFRVVNAKLVFEPERLQFERQIGRSIFHFDEYDSGATLEAMSNHSKHRAEPAPKCMHPTRSEILIADEFLVYVSPDLVVTQTYPTLTGLVGFDMRRDDLTRDQLARMLSVIVVDRPDVA